MSDEFLRFNRDIFEVQCCDLVDKATNCEKKLVEIEMKRHVIMVQAEPL